LNAPACRQQIDISRWMLRWRIRRGARVCCASKLLGRQALALKNAHHNGNRWEHPHRTQPYASRAPGYSAHKPDNVDKADK
jgi:hypothetical protein